MITVSNLCGLPGEIGQQWYLQHFGVCASLNLIHVQLIPDYVVVEPELKVASTPNNFWNMISLFDAPSSCTQTVQDLKVCSCPLLHEFP